MFNLQITYKTPELSMVFEHRTGRKDSYTIEFQQGQHVTIDHFVQMLFLELTLAHVTSPIVYY